MNVRSINREVAGGPRVASAPRPSAWREVLGHPELAHLGPHLIALLPTLDHGSESHAMVLGMNVRSGNRKPSKQTAAAAHAPRKRGRPVVDDKRRRILDAALKTFAERGFHGTAVPQVATAAGIGTGTLYHYFEHKQQLVNEVYRDAKFRLRSALLDHLVDPDLDKPGAAEAWFNEVWQRLAAFARREPEAFRFLEMQDHVEYLDIESRQVEISTLGPLFLVGKRLHDRAGGPRIDVVIALMWGAFVGLVKASRLGYLRLDDESLETAGATVWRMLAPEALRALKAKPRRPRG